MMTEVVKSQLLDEMCAIYNSGCIRGYLYAQFKKLKKEDREDILNDTFTYALGQLESLRRHDKLRLWLYKIARSYALMELRRQNQEIAALQRLYNKEICSSCDESFAGDDTVYSEVARREIREQLMSLYEQLPERYKEVIWLYYKEEFSLKEIAGLLDANYNSIRCLHIRGIEKLREIAKQKGVTFNG